MVVAANFGLLPEPLRGGIDQRIVWRPPATCDGGASFPLWLFTTTEGGREEILKTYAGAGTGVCSDKDTSSRRCFGTDSGLVAWEPRYTKFRWLKRSFTPAVSAAQRCPAGKAKPPRTQELRAL